ncbi:MAG: Hpt domain-containing protein [Pseudomonadales bacterium]
MSISKEAGLMPHNEGDHLDADIVAELEEIMEDDFGVLLETYLDDATQKITGLQAALNANDAGELRELAHSFKGASCNIGALPLSRLCETVEDLAKQGELAEVGPLLPGIENEYAAVKSLLSSKLA